MEWPAAKFSEMTEKIGISLAASVIGITASAVCADTLNWKMNSLLHPNLFGESGRIFASAVMAESDGSLSIAVGDQMVLDVDAFEALRIGLVDAVWGSPGHHYRENPSLMFFGGFPFGPEQAELNKWMSEGGQDILNEIYAEHGLRSIVCGALPMETGGWMRAPVTTLTDLDGLSMRSFGYGAATLEALGVTTYTLAARDIRPAFETGVIAAAEFAMPSIDAELELWDLAPYLYMPGWQQPATSLEVLMAETTWLSLSMGQKQALEAGCEAVRNWTQTVAVARQVEAVAQFQEHGVMLRQWPEPVLSEFREAWIEIIAGEAEMDPTLARAWASYQASIGN